MNTNPFIEAREKLPSAITTLPPNYLEGNAAALLAIVEELKKSYRVELGIIRAIKNLDVAEPEAVAQLKGYFEDYHQSRDFDNERTHCHNIDRIVQELLTPLRAGTHGDRERVTQVEYMLKLLGNNDDDFLDEIEPLMYRALAAMETINKYAQAGRNDPARFNDAHSEQQKFAREFDPLFEHLKARLKEMNTLANDLIDRL